MLILGCSCQVNPLIFYHLSQWHQKPPLQEFEYIYIETYTHTHTYTPEHVFYQFKYFSVQLLLE